MIVQIAVGLALITPSLVLVAVLVVDKMKAKRADCAARR